MIFDIDWMVDCCFRVIDNASWLTVPCVYTRWAAAISYIDDMKQKLANHQNNKTSLDQPCQPSMHGLGSVMIDGSISVAGRILPVPTQAKEALIGMLV